MANFNSPTDSTLKEDVLSEIKDRAEDIATMARPTANTPTGYISWNSGSNKFQQWNGSAWVDLSSTYDITVSAVKLLSQIKTVDGAGSGLDADTLDSLNSSSFMRSDASTSTSGSLTVGGNFTHGGLVNHKASSSTDNPRTYMTDENGDAIGLIFKDRTSNRLSIRNYSTAGGTDYDSLHIGVDSLKFNSYSVPVLGLSPQYDDNNYLHLSRDSVSPALYVNQYGAGPIARFINGSNSASTTSSSDFFEITNDGGFSCSGESTIDASIYVSNISVNNGAIATAVAGSPDGSFESATNIDHIWHDDSNNQWHFVSDSTYKAAGNSTIICGGMIIDGKNVLLEGDVSSDAETLDGLDSSQFLRSDAADQKTSGTLRFNDSVQLSFGTNDDAEFFHNGTDMYIDVNNGGNIYVRDGNSGGATRLSFDTDNGVLNTSGGFTHGGAAVWSNANDALNTGTDGYCKLPNGMLIQWGRVTSIAETGAVSGSFPIAFPNRCNTMTLSMPSQASTTNAAVWRSDHTSLTTSTYLIQKGGWSGTGGGGSQTAHWIAIGY